ncbi:hypothetical protein SCALM49S_08130 [Streptomyces californicus]
MMTTRACTETARARATICWVPMPRVCSGRLGVDADAEAVQEFGGLPVHPGEVDEPETVLRLPAQEDVARHAHQRDEVHLLVDGGDPGLLRLERAGEADGFAADAHLPLVAPVDAGEHLDEGGLAGAVLADERVDLARAQREGDVVQGDDAREPLAHGAGFEDGVGDGGPGPGGLRGRGCRVGWCHGCWPSGVTGTRGPPRPPGGARRGTRRPGCRWERGPGPFGGSAGRGLRWERAPGLRRGLRVGFRHGRRSGQYAPPSDFSALDSSYARSAMMTFSGIASPA